MDGWDVFCCDLSPAQASAVKASFAASGQARTIEHLNLVATNQNLEWNLESDSLGQGVNAVVGIAEDLLALAAHVHQADRMVKRPAEPRGWSRQFELHVGVSDVTPWEKQKADIVAILRELTQDMFRLHFHPLAESRPPLRLPLLNKPVVGGICVFSTRFGAAFGFVTQAKMATLIASVRYGPDSPKSSQERLQKQIEGLTNTFDAIGFRMKPTNLASVERTQRTLGFLQLALAAVIAHRLGEQTIQLFDDAVSSYHLQARQLCGPGFAVRDSRPDFLERMRQLLDGLDIASGKLQILHPFQFSTAVDVLKLPDWLAKDQLKSLLAQTDNCLEKELAKALRKNWKDAPPHCGCCFPCKMRRLAALGAHLEDPGDFSAYAINPLRKHAVGKLGRNLGERVEKYHNEGLPLLKSYLHAFKGGKVTNPFTKQLLIPLKSTKLVFGTAPPDASGTSLSEDDVERGIIGVHESFGKQVLKYL